MYHALKHSHVLFVALSGALFLLRGCWMMADSAKLQQRWVKVLPHVVDTLLLASAIALAVATGQYPLAQAWLTAKVVALLLYIVLGVAALKRGKTKTVRVVAFAGALATFAYIVLVALSKHPLPLVS
ncbi:MAG: SirB2 family protein [Pseudomonadota bacterium]